MLGLWSDCIGLTSLHWEELAIVADWEQLSEPQCQQCVWHALFLLSNAGVAGTQQNIYWSQPDRPAPSRCWTVIAYHGLTARWRRTRSLTVLLTVGQRLLLYMAVETVYNGKRQRRTMFLAVFLWLTILSGLCYDPLQSVVVLCGYCYGSFLVTANAFWSLLCSFVVLCCSLWFCAVLCGI